MIGVGPEQEEDVGNHPCSLTAFSLPGPSTLRLSEPLNKPAKWVLLPRFTDGKSDTPLGLKTTELGGSVG